MKIGRNDPCPCGSGKKSKHCHSGGSDQEQDVFQTTGLSVKARSSGQPAAGAVRPCDGCTACCTAMTINDPALVTPAEERCPKLNDHGCSIHGESMPDACAAFICNYLTEPSRVTLDERPDRVGVIVRRALHPRKKGPPERVTYVNECFPGGLANGLDNQFWGYVIRHDLLAGTPLVFSWTQDPLGREMLPVRFSDGRIGCELTSCQADGTPICKPHEPVHERPVQLVLLIPDQDYVFDARVLIDHLSQGQSTVICGSGPVARANNLHFLFTRRQATLLEELLSIVGAHRPAEGQVQVCV